MFNYQSLFDLKPCLLTAKDVALEDVTWERDIFMEIVVKSLINSVVIILEQEKRKNV